MHKGLNDGGFRKVICLGSVFLTSLHLVELSQKPIEMWGEIMYFQLKYSMHSIIISLKRTEQLSPTCLIKEVH